VEWTNKSPSQVMETRVPGDCLGRGGREEAEIWKMKMKMKRDVRRRERKMGGEKEDEAVHWTK
jgi:hypothetical protein